MTASDIRYKKGIDHVKKTGLLTDPLYMTQVRNAIHIAAYGHPLDKEITTQLRDEVMDNRV